MSSPKFLSVDEVREIHRDAIAQFGGTLGIRDEGTLIAAVFHPQNVWHLAELFRRLFQKQK